MRFSKVTYRDADYASPCSRFAICDADYTASPISTSTLMMRMAHIDDGAADFVATF